MKVNRFWKFKGVFVNDKKDGHGVFTSKSGDRYEGKQTFKKKNWSQKRIFNQFIYGMLPRFCGSQIDLHTFNNVKSCGKFLK